MPTGKFVYVVQSNSKLFRIYSNTSRSKAQLQKLVANNKQRETCTERKYPLANELVKNKIIRHIKPVAFKSEPRIYGFVAKISSGAFDQNAGGFSTNRKKAYDGCTGEAIERYSLVAQSKIADTAPLSYDEISKYADATRPDEFVLFNERQYDIGDFVPFKADVKVCWMKGTDIITGTEKYVPAQMVHVFYSSREGEKRVDYSSSSGAACSRDLDSAIKSGVLELLERDALMMMWLLKEPPCEINISKIKNLDTSVYTGFFNKEGIQLHSYLLRSYFGAPVVLSIGFKRGSAVKAYLGCACRLSLKEAILHSWDEVIQSQTINSLEEDELERYKAIAPDDIRMVDQRISLLLNEEFIRKNLKFIIDSKDEAQLGSTMITKTIPFIQVLTKLAVAGIRPIAVNITPDEVKKLGYVVLKVIAPGLQPLDIIHKYRHVGPNSRVYRTGKKINEEPHPFY